jgi:hypothetical protein
MAGGHGRPDHKDQLLRKPGGGIAAPAKIKIIIIDALNPPGTNLGCERRLRRRPKTGYPGRIGGLRVARQKP